MAKDRLAKEKEGQGRVRAALSRGEGTGSWLSNKEKKAMGEQAAKDLIEAAKMRQSTDDKNGH